MKKLNFYILLIAIFVESVFGFYISAGAAEWISTDEWDYYIDKTGNAELKSYHGSECTELVVPSEIDGYKVKSIDLDESGRERVKNVESVILPEGLEEISDFTFYELKNLKNVNIPRTVKYIGDGAFEYCDSLEEIIIPEGVKYIGMYVFGYCDSLEEIIIPESVEEVDQWAFDGCKNLKKVTILGSNMGIYMFANCESLIDVYLSDKITSIPQGAFASCYSLKEITISKNITEIGKIAFQYTALENVIIPESVEKLDYGAFSDCENLKEVILKNPNTTFEEKKGPPIGPGLRNTLSTFGACDAITTVYAPITSQAEEFFSAKGIPVVPVVKVEVNGEEVKTDVPPILLEGRVLIPARAMFEALGAQIGWEENTRTVTAMTSEKNVAMQIDNTQMSVNGLTTELDVAPRILINRTLVPARAISESLGANVEWDEERQTVVVTY